VEVPSSDGLGSHGLVPKAHAGGEPKTHRPAWDAAPIGARRLSNGAGMRAGAVSLTCESPAHSMQERRWSRSPEPGQTDLRGWSRGTD
jgi:hypothetical protein